MYKIIALNGPPRSGKDTSCVILEQLLFQINPMLRVKIQPFSKPLKEAVHTALQIFDERGYIAAYDYFEAVKDQQMPEFLNMTPREAYIWFSEEVMKPRFGQDIYGRLWNRNFAAEHNSNTIWLIPDNGFRSEIESIASIAGAENLLRLRIVRRGFSFVNDSRSYYPNPENIKVADIVNNGDVVDLRKILMEMLNAYNIGT